MGRYAQLYVGPYVTCEVTETPAQVSVRACTNAGCARPKPKTIYEKVVGPFCNLCGSPVGDVAITTMKHPSPYDALGESERLSAVQPDDTNQRVYFICNEGGAAARNFHIEPESHVGLDGFHVEHEMQWFEERYAVELEALGKAYGNFSLHWGVHYFAR